MMEQIWDAREQQFNDTVREYFIVLFFFSGLYLLCYVGISYFKRQADKEDYYASEAEDAMVYRIALWVCTFTLAVSCGAVLLLPFSIISNEVLLIYPNSYYMQWLNGSLIHGLWNHVFLFTNLSFFVSMPFAYLLTESEGFAGWKKGIKARIFETMMVLFLLSVLVFGLVWVAMALFDDEDESGVQMLLDVWTSYLPLLYSCLSILGVVMLLISTPLGFARMFTVIGKLVVKPQFMEDLEGDYERARVEEEALIRKLNANSIKLNSKKEATDANHLSEELLKIQKERQTLDRRRRASSWQRNLFYPLVWILMFALTVVFLITVGWNVFRLLFGIQALPISIKEAGLGKVSLSMFGTLGATVEVVLILYLMSASIVGFYGVPIFRFLIPQPHDTPMTKIIINSYVILILSSALPVLSRTLGLTNFDILDEFGRFDSLNNFYLLIVYNMLFGVATYSCVLNKFTTTVRDALLHRFSDYVDKVQRSNKLRFSSLKRFTGSKVQINAAVKHE